MKVSVIMGTYNGEATVACAIASIQRQTETDWEFIICDDGSTDRTWVILQALAQDDPRIKPIRNQPNAGIEVSLNRCLHAAQAPLIAVMDDDDIAQPHRLQVERDFLIEHPDVAVVGSCVNLFDVPGHDGGRRWVPTKPTASQVFRGKNFVHPSTMMRKSALMAVGGYTVAPYVKRCEDFDLWCKLYAHGFRGYNLREPVLDYHESPMSVQRRYAKNHLHVRRVMGVWRKQLDLPRADRFYPIVPWLKAWVPQRLLLNLRYRKIMKTPKGEG